MFIKKKKKKRLIVEKIYKNKNFVDFITNNYLKTKISMLKKKCFIVEKISKN
jgi:hypothetical protein